MKTRPNEASPTTRAMLVVLCLALVACVPRPARAQAVAAGEHDADILGVRVVYKKLARGELQILFAEGKWVKEIVLTYAAKPSFADLRLAPTGSIAVMGAKDNLDSHIQFGGRYDDRYSIGYTSDRKLERFCWRDDPTPAGYRVRVGFISERFTGSNQLAAKTIARKMVSVTPGDEEKFARALASR